MEKLDHPGNKLYKNRNPTVTKRRHQQPRSKLLRRRRKRMMIWTCFEESQAD